MHCNTSQKVLSSQWDFSALVETVELFAELSYSASIPKQLLQRWFGTSRTRASVLFIVVSIRRKFIFIWTLLCVAIFSEASRKDDTKSRGLYYQRKMGSCINLDNINTEIGMCFPIHVVPLSLKFSSSTQLDPKPKIAMLNSFCLSVRDAKRV